MLVASLLSLCTPKFHWFSVVCRICHQLRRRLKRKLFGKDKFALDSLDRCINFETALLAEQWWATGRTAETHSLVASYAIGFHGPKGIIQTLCDNSLLLPCRIFDGTGVTGAGTWQAALNRGIPCVVEDAHGSAQVTRIMAMSLLWIGYRHMIEARVQFCCVVIWFFAFLLRMKLKLM